MIAFFKPSTQARRPDAITYRLQPMGQMKCVTPADKYEVCTYVCISKILLMVALQKALDYAFQAFDELHKVKRNQIWFSYEVLKPDNTRKNTRIGLDTWASIAPHFVRDQVIDVHIQPELTVQDVDSTLPPSNLLRTEEDYVAPPKQASSPTSRLPSGDVAHKLVPQPVRKSANSIAPVKISTSSKNPRSKSANSIAPVKTSGKNTSSPVKYPKRSYSSNYKLA